MRLRAVRLTGVMLVAAMAASFVDADAGAPRGAPVSGRGATAAAWSRAGHDIICEIAFQRLTDAGRALVLAIREHDPDPSATFYRSCAWPDSSRHQDHKATYEYHFMNVADPDADELVMGRDCASYDCVPLAVVRYGNYLTKDPGRSESMRIRRANALKFVSHFVGDLHQPLHVGYGFDRGGNDTYVDFYDEENQNLHAVWDTHIPNRMGLLNDPIATARRLDAEITDAEVDEWESLDVASWSRESFDVVKTLVYDIPADGKLGDDYFSRARPIVEKRFKQAGVRLAYLLNRAAAGTLEFPPMFEGR